MHGTEQLQMSCSTKQNMRSKLVIWLLQPIVFSWRQNRQRAKIYVVHHDTLLDSFRIQIVWFQPKQDSDRIRISFLKNRIGSDSKKHYQIISASFIYLCIPCYCECDACLKSSTLRVGVKTLHNTIHTTAQPQHDGGKSYLRIIKKRQSNERTCQLLIRMSSSFRLCEKKTTKTRRKIVSNLKKFISEVMTTYFKISAKCTNLKSRTLCLESQTRSFWWNLGFGPVSKF